MPKIPKKCPKWGSLFDQFFSKLTQMHPSFSPIFGKKCGFPPRRLAQRGDKPHFFPKICENEGCIYVSFLKNWSKRGVPHFGHFLGILGISGENGVPYWPPRQCKPAEKAVHLPSGVISEVLPRVNFALPACPGPKSTLGGTSEMTPEGRCTVFSAGLHCLGGQ